MIRLSNLKDTTPYYNTKQNDKSKLSVFFYIFIKDMLFGLFLEEFLKQLQNKCVELCHIDMTTYIWTV